MHPDFLLEVANAAEKAEALSTGFGVGELLRCLGDQRLSLAEAVGEAAVNPEATLVVSEECAKVAAWAAVIWSKYNNA